MNEEKNEDTSDIELVPDEEGDASELQKKIKKTKEDLKKCDAERKDYLEGWQRAKADLINYRKDEGKRFEDLARFVTTGFIEEVLPILDSFDLAVGHGLEPETERGVLLIRSQFEDILRKRGLEVMKVEKGERFDPEKHESIGEIESEFEAGSIGDVVQRGYYFRERVLRPARVRIAKEK